MDMQKQSYAGEGQEAVVYNESFHRLMRMFTVSVLISFLGTVFGLYFVPPAFIIPLVVVEFVMLISAFFIRRKGRAVGYGFVFTFCFISGITIFPAIIAYANIGGPKLIMQAFILTVAIFSGLSLYGYYSKRDFGFLRGFLMVGIMALIGVGIIQLFVGGFGGTLGLVISFGGIMVFSGFILYDISQYRHGLEESMIPLAVLSLYLSFINLFLYLLRFLGILQDD